MEKQAAICGVVKGRYGNRFCDSWIARQSAFVLKPAKAAANGKRPRGEQERDLFAPDRVLHSGCDIRWNAAQHELSVIILCGVADGVCLGPKKQHDLVGELLQRPLCGRFQKCR